MVSNAPCASSSSCKRGVESLQCDLRRPAVAVRRKLPLQCRERRLDLPRGVDDALHRPRFFCSIMFGSHRSLRSRNPDITNGCATAARARAASHALLRRPAAVDLQRRTAHFVGGFRAEEHRQLADLLRRHELFRRLFLAQQLRARGVGRDVSRAAISSICFCTSGVSTKPGQIAFTVTPVRAFSSAATFVRPTMPCFAATYADFPADPTSPCADAILITRPQPLSRIFGQRHAHGVKRRASG